MQKEYFMNCQLSALLSTYNRHFLAISCETFLMSKNSYKNRFILVQKLPSFTVQFLYIEHLKWPENYQKIFQISTIWGISFFRSYNEFFPQNFFSKFFVAQCLLIIAIMEIGTPTTSTLKVFVANITILMLYDLIINIIKYL